MQLAEIDRHAANRVVGFRVGALCARLFRRGRAAALDLVCGIGLEALGQFARGSQLRVAVRAAIGRGAGWPAHAAASRSALDSIIDQANA
jgi:hypothetical protein